MSRNEFAYGIYLGTVMELDARRMGFNSVDSFDHNSPQSVHFEMSTTFEFSFEAGCEKG